VRVDDEASGICQALCLGGSYSGEREAGGGGGGRGGGGVDAKVKGAGGNKRKKRPKKQKPPAPPLATDKQCQAVLKLLDDRCEVIASPGARLDAAVAACAAEAVIAVDCEAGAYTRPLFSST